jgi:hypothetical protein
LLESKASVKTAATASLTTSQSGGWELRIRHGVSTEKPQEQPVMQTDQSDAGTRQITERKARTTHSARKQKECTEVKQIHKRSRHTERTQTTPEEQASLDAHAYSTIVNQQPRPIMESERIQHQDQVQPRRALLAHGKGSTGNSSDVPDTGKMATSMRNVPATASLISTSQGDKGSEGDYETQSLELKSGGSSGIGGVG